MNIQLSEVMMSYPHNFLHISFTENDKNLIFRYVTVNVTFYPPKINEKLCLFWHISKQGYAFICIRKKKKKKKKIKISCIVSSWLYSSSRLLWYTYKYIIIHTLKTRSIVSFKTDGRSGCMVYTCTLYNKNIQWKLDIKISDITKYLT